MKLRNAHINIFRSRFRNRLYQGELVGHPEGFGKEIHTFFRGQTEEFEERDEAVNAINKLAEQLGIKERCE